MALLRVLIVEDEPLVSMSIEEIVEDTVPSVVIVKSSVAEAKAVIEEIFHFALLDVDVTNGKTYEIARLLDFKRVPYVFVSGSVKSHLPAELQNVPFIAKPFLTSQIRDAVLAASQQSGN
jgi:DNA-binding LytR/AlgR family response regulator